MGRPPKFDDTAVLDRATDLFWQRGTDAVSIRDLEAALDLKAPSIYRRFHSKEQLLANCIDRYVDQQVSRRVQRLLADPDDPLAGLRWFFTSVLHPHQGEQGLRGCLLTNTSPHADVLTPEIRAAVDRGFQLIEAALVGAVGRAIDAGQLAADRDPVATGAALLLAFQGVLVLARAGASDLPARVDATLVALELN